MGSKCKYFFAIFLMLFSHHSLAANELLSFAVGSVMGTIVKKEIKKFSETAVVTDKKEDIISIAVASVLPAIVYLNGRSLTKEDLFLAVMGTVVGVKFIGGDVFIKKEVDLSKYSIKIKNEIILQDVGFIDANTNKILIDIK